MKNFIWMRSVFQYGYLIFIILTINEFQILYLNDIKIASGYLVENLNSYLTDTEIIYLLKRTEILTIIRIAYNKYVLIFHKKHYTCPKLLCLM